MANTLTPLGRELRKLRIDLGIDLQTMANRIGKSAAFLSAVELGNKPAPQDLVPTIVDAFDFGQTKTEETLREAYRQSVRRATLTADTPLASRTLSMLADRFSTLSTSQYHTIQDILTGAPRTGPRSASRL